MERGVFEARELVDRGVTVDARPWTYESKAAAVDALRGLLHGDHTALAPDSNAARLFSA
jgi:hypothetical protein